MDSNLAIRDIMATDVIMVRPDDTLSHIRRIFEKNNFHHLPVVEPGEKLVGIISRTDYVKIAYVLSLNTADENMTAVVFPELFAKDIMTPQPMSVEPMDTLGLAADIFLANKFHALPVVEDDQLVGIVTTHDLLKFCFDLRVENLENKFYDE